LVYAFFYFRRLKINNIIIEFECDDFVIVNKPHGVLSHPTNTSKELTVSDFLKNKYKLDGVGDNGREGIVHRLDRVTTGLMVCPIKDESYILFKRMFHDRNIKKYYKALVEGKLVSKTGEIELPLKRSSKNRKKREVNKDGKKAITKYSTTLQDERFSLIEIELITGRNHQIRTHFEFLGNPVVNDVLYGAKKNSILESNTICLQSYKLNFTFKDKNYDFNIEMPEYFTSIMNM
jgi:23S rRNA pseudouridine1911/1915/1917 synthase